MYTYMDAREYTYGAWLYIHKCMYTYTDAREYTYGAWRESKDADPIYTYMIGSVYVCLCMRVCWRMCIRKGMHAYMYASVYVCIDRWM